MTTGIVTNPNGISALDENLVGCTLPAGTYTLHPYPGDAAFAYIRHPVSDKLVCIGRNDPGVTVIEEA